MHSNPTPSPVPPVRILSCWKEIAVYVGRGIRTLQRYEERFGFPVHRPARNNRSSVFAFADEIDLWLRNTPQCKSDGTIADDVEVAKKQVEEAYAAYQLTLRRYNELKSRALGRKSGSDHDTGIASKASHDSAA